MESSRPLTYLTTEFLEAHFEADYAQVSCFFIKKNPLISTLGNFLCFYGYQFYFMVSKLTFAYDKSKN